MFKIRIAKDGTILSINKLISWEPESITNKMLYYDDLSWTGTELDKYYKEGVLLVNTFARDEEHAKKIAVEKRQQILREGKWK